ncbi:MAG: ribonuclease P protein component [Patescibacteria group bacterium]|jgi:ribonuclease P protein component
MLKRDQRLVLENDFKRLAQKGKPAYSTFFNGKVLANKELSSRFGIVISAKTSKKAVVRNTIKRRLTEIIRLHLDKIKPGFDLMIVVKKEAIDKDYQTLESDLAELFDKAKLLSPLKERDSKSKIKD